jgi:outer membrane protein with beta-barrel domain
MRVIARRAQILAAAIVLASSPPVAAQAVSAATTSGARPAVGRVHVSINGMFQTAGSDFQDSVTYRENAEDARIDSDYSMKSGPGFDISGGVVLSRKLGVGAGLTRFPGSSTAAITGSIPHPFFFNQPRTVTGEASDLKRDELAVHIQARGVFPVGQRVLLTIFGGPSFFTVEQALVSSIHYTESYPYDDAVFDSAVTESVEDSAVGVNLGGDVGYFFSRQVGVGVGGQYTRANVELPSTDGGTVEVKAGGFQIVGGLRLRF